MVAAIIVAALIGAGATVYSQQKAATAEKELQSEALDFQTAQANAAEAKVKGAEVLAEQTAVEKLKKKRLSQTNTILTSPLGITDTATTGKATLLGG